MISLPKLYSQNDPAWQNNALGTSDSTIGNEGCYVAAYANLANYYGHDVNVQQMNDLLRINGQFLEGNRMMSGDSLSVLYPEIKWQTRGMDWALFSQYLADGYPVIINVSASTLPNAVSSHFVLVLNYTGDILTIADSWDGVIKENPYGGIQEMFFFKGKLPIKFSAEDSNLANQINQDNMFKDNLKTQISKQGFDSETTTNLINAVDGNDYSYILAFAGSDVRNQLANKELEIESKSKATQEIIDKLQKDLADVTKPDLSGYISLEDATAKETVAVKQAVETEKAESKKAYDELIKQTNAVVEELHKEITQNEIDLNEMEIDNKNAGTISAKIQSFIKAYPQVKISGIFQSKTVQIVLAGATGAFTIWQTTGDWKLTLGSLLTGIAAAAISADKDSQKLKTLDTLNW